MIQPTNYTLLTQNVHHHEAIVERKAQHKPAKTERPKGVGKGGRHTEHETQQVAAHQRWNPSKSIGNPAEQQATNNGANEKDRLCKGRKHRVVTHPIVLFAPEKLQEWGGK